MDFAFVDTHTAAGWNEWRGYGTTVDERDRLVLPKTSASTFVAPELVVDEGELVGDAVDVDLDDCGRLYVLTTAGELYEYDPRRDASRSIRRIRCVGDGTETADLDPRALRVTRDTIYVAYAAPTPADADDPPSGRVRAISRHLLQTRWVVEDPFVRPVRIVESSGTVSVLDREGFLAVLDEEGHAEPVVTGLEDPRDVGVGDDGSYVVLDREGGEPIVRAYDSAFDEVAGGGIPPPAFVAIGTGESVRAVCLAVTDGGRILVGVAPDAPGERTLFRYVPERGGFERIPSYKRSCVRLARGIGWTTRTDRRDGLFAIDGDAHLVYFLEAAARTRLTRGGAAPYDGRSIRRFDAGEPEMAWHRVTTRLGLDGPGTRVRLYYFATDDAEVRPDDLEMVSNVGPTFAERFRRANVVSSAELLDFSAEEIADIAETTVARAERILDGASERVSAPDYAEVPWTELDVPDPTDALLEGAAGRYLWVQLELVGTEDHSPWVESFRGYFPQQSYLRYLPAIYEEDDRSADFLEGFLSIFESGFVEVDENLAGITRYLDPGGIPSDSLDWLGGWLGVEFDETWSDSAKRTVVESAADLFTRRGTREGLLALLRIYLGLGDDTEPPTPGPEWDDAHRHEAALLDRLVDDGYLTAADREDALAVHESLAAAYTREQPPLVFEYADFECIDSPRVRTVYERLIGRPECFLVLVGSAVDDEQLRTVKRLVDAEKPAHAVGRAVQLRSRVELGVNTYLGINSTLSRPAFVLERAGLGKDSVLVEREPFAHLGVKAELGGDAVIS